MFFIPLSTSFSLSLEKDSFLSHFLRTRSSVLSTTNIHLSDQLILSKVRERKLRRKRNQRYEKVKKILVKIKSYKSNFCSVLLFPSSAIQFSSFFGSLQLSLFPLSLSLNHRIFLTVQEWLYQLVEEVARGEFFISLLVPCRK